jgi:hypothetical protein
MGVAKPLFFVLIGFGALFLISRSIESSKELPSCKPMLESHYQESFRKALADDSLWKLGGYESAQDYAKVSSDLYLEGLRKSQVCR